MGRRRRHPSIQLSMRRTARGVVNGLRAAFAGGLVVGLLVIPVGVAAAGTGSWTAVTSMPTARFHLGATTGIDGTIYAIGGEGGGTKDTVEAYDPVFDTWITASSLPTPRYAVAAATGDDGTVYAIGGNDAALDDYTDEMTAYDPSSDSWTAVASMPTRRGYLAAVTGSDGTIYAIGGFDPVLGSQTGAMEAYDPTTDVWTTLAPMPTPRYSLGAAIGSDGTIYAIGGYSGQPTSVVEAYNPATDSWTTVAPMPTARQELAVETGSDGTIYAIGGGGVGSVTSNAVEAYDPTSDTWTTVASMPAARVALAAATASNGKIYAMGGCLPGVCGVDTVEVFDPAPGGPALGISNVVELADPVGRFDRFEADIELTRTYADPFDPDEVSVDVTFTAPSGAMSSMPAFWFQDFEVRAGTESFEVYDPVGEPSWRVRFAPTEVGAYSYVVHAVDGLGGSADSTPMTFEVAATDNPGFVRVDEADDRFFRFDRGAPYVPLGHNAGFDTANPPLNGTSYYEALFDESFAPQENWTRIWMTDFNRSALEWGPGHWSGFYDGVGAYSLPAAWRMDQVLGSAEAHGLYVQLVLNDHGQYNSRADGRWQVRCNDPSDGCTPGEPGYDPGNPYSDAVGGPVPADRPDQFFSDARARELFERRLRYVVARWGGYTNVLAWELFNEVQFVGSDAHNPYNDPAMWADVLDWHQEMASYLATIDPNDHLVTTSSDPAPAGADLGSVPGIDIVQVHDYTVPSEARDASIARVCLAAPEPVRQAGHHR